MKTTAASPSAPSSPDFGGIRRMKLDQMVTVKGYGKLKIRPIRLDAEEEMTRFHKHLSEESVYLRYFEYLGLDRRTSHERLIRVSTNTPESYALVVERPAVSRHPAAILAVGRLTKTPEHDVTSFDILMSDEEKASQLGKVLLTRLIRLARAFGFRVLIAELLVADHAALNLCRALGFTLHTFPHDGLVQAILDL